MYIQPLDIGRVIAVRFNTGDDILAGLERVATREKITSAIILSGVGSVKSHHYHVVSTRTLPPENAFVKGTEALDIVNINGMVIDGRIHAHIIMSDTEKALGGHLELGCEVLTFAMVMIAVINGV